MPSVLLVQPKLTKVKPMKKLHSVTEILEETKGSQELRYFEGLLGEGSLWVYEGCVFPFPENDLADYYDSKYEDYAPTLKETLKYSCLEITQESIENGEWEKEFKEGFVEVSL